MFNFAVCPLLLPLSLLHSSWLLPDLHLLHYPRHLLRHLSSFCDMMDQSAITMVSCFFRTRWWTCCPCIHGGTRTLSGVKNHWTDRSSGQSETRSELVNVQEKLSRDALIACLSTALLGWKCWKVRENAVEPWEKKDHERCKQKTEKNSLRKREAVRNRMGRKNESAFSLMSFRDRSQWSHHQELVAEAIDESISCLCILSALKKNMNDCLRSGQAGLGTIRLLWSRALRRVQSSRRRERRARTSGGSDRRWWSRCVGGRGIVTARSASLWSYQGLLHIWGNVSSPSISFSPLDRHPLLSRHLLLRWMANMCNELCRCCSSILIYPFLFIVYLTANTLLNGTCRMSLDVVLADYWASEAALIVKPAFVSSSCLFEVHLSCPVVVFLLSSFWASLCLFSLSPSFIFMPAFSCLYPFFLVHYRLFLPLFIIVFFCRCFCWILFVQFRGLHTVSTVYFAL